MTVKTTLLATALVTLALPAAAQSTHVEVGNLSFDKIAADISAPATPERVTASNEQTFAANALKRTETKQPAPVLSFASGQSASGSQDTVSRNANSDFNTGRDWTGFYVGGQIGFANVDTNISSDDDDFIGGIFVGYDYDLGNVVIGGGLDYDFTDADVADGVADLENIFRLRARAGYKIGSGLLYGTAGYAIADTDTLGSDDGYFIGAGYEHFVSQNFTIGGEVLYHEFNSFDSTGVDVEATTVQIRGTFRF